MAVDYYGQCSGTDGGKYDLWLNVEQISNDRILGVDKISVGFYLKRNDGVADSFYNTNLNENYVELVVDGKSVVKGYVSVDTRNGEVVSLARWEGDIKRNSEGDIEFSLFGKITMGNEELSGGEVNAVYKDASTPRASVIYYNVAVINPGTTVKLDIVSVSSEYTHRIAWGIGNTGVSVNYARGVDKAEFTVPFEWAEEVKDSCNGTFKIAIRTYRNSVAVGTSYYNIDFVIPQTDEFLPSFETVLEKYDGIVPDEWNLWVQGVSQLRVIPDNLTFKHGATLSALTITVGSVSKRSLPAIFELHEKGNVKITVAVRDSRGMSTVKTTSIEVIEYSAPSINVRQLLRCASDGTVDTSGENLLLDYVIGYSDVKTKNSYKLKIKYRASDYAVFSDEINIVDKPAVFGESNIKNNKSYVVTINVSDEINKSGIDVVRFVPDGDVPFNIRRGGKGAAFGKYSEKENELSVKWNLSVDGDVDFKGKLNYEEVEVKCTPLTEQLNSDVRYFPCLGAVFITMNLVTATPLSANDTYYIATVSGKLPAVFTPLSSMANFDSGGQSTGGIMSNSGMITFRSDVVIPKGTTIYISGLYMTDYSE